MSLAKIKCAVIGVMMTVVGFTPVNAEVSQEMAVVVDGPFDGAKLPKTIEERIRLCLHIINSLPTFHSEETKKEVDGMYHAVKCPDFSWYAPPSEDEK